MTRRQFHLAAIGVILFAFMLREWHILASVLPHPTQGDVSSYLRYALHMAWDGVYTQAGNGQPLVPDAYRSPGYPVFLLGVFKLSGLQAWYPAVYQAQAVIGALTVGGVIALARQWLPYHWALLAGALLSLWPHHIAATNAMLIEIVFGFVIIVALLLTAVALSRRSLSWSIAAGAVFGCAYLVNPVIALFPVALSVVFWRERETKLGVTILLVSLIAVVGWGARNTVQGAAGDGRAWQNLVQGAWPGYHHAEKWWPSSPTDRELRARIKTEMDTIMDDRAVGLRRIGTRLAEDPGIYAAWYLIHKPYLLWEWDIRMGQGGIYTLEVLNSPLERGVLHGATAALAALNPALFILAVGFTLVGFKQGGSASIAAMFFLYITAVHMVFQAEPRYAIAYRPVEMILIAGALAQLARIWGTPDPSLAQS